MFSEQFLPAQFGPRVLSVVQPTSLEIILPSLKYISKLSSPCHSGATVFLETLVMFFPPWIIIIASIVP